MMIHKQNETQTKLNGAHYIHYFASRSLLSKIFTISPCFYLSDIIPELYTLFIKNTYNFQTPMKQKMNVKIGPSTSYLIPNPLKVSKIISSHRLVY